MNVSVCLTKHRVMKGCAGVEVYYHVFLSALYAKSGRFHNTEVFTQRNDRTLSLPNIKSLFLDRSARCLIES